MRQKYIILDDLNGILDIPILFPVFIQHIDMANKFGGKENVISAGIVLLNNDNDVIIERGSISLGIEPDNRKDLNDSRIIERSFKIESM